MKTLLRLLAILILLGSCSPTVHIMPEGCKPEKKVKRTMVEPEATMEKYPKPKRK